MTGRGPLVVVGYILPVDTMVDLVAAFLEGRSVRPGGAVTGCRFAALSIV